MVQYNTSRNGFMRPADEVYDVVMVANKNGNVVTTSNRFPVDAIIGGATSYAEAGNLSGSVDAFGRLRQSTPYTLFDSHNLLNKNNKFDESVSGSATVTYDSSISQVNLNVTNASGDEVVRQSYRNFSYQPGKSLLILNTFVFSEPKSNLRQRVGYFNNDGIYLEQDGTDVYLVLRNGGVNNRISQSNWNVNKLDGTEDNGITLDLTKSQIMWMDIEWLGVGSVRTGFVINGQFIICHIFHNSNINAGVYMSSPNLPVRYEITNTGATTGNSSLGQICSTVISEGGYEARAVENVIGTSALTGQSVGTDYVNLATITLRQSGAVVVPSGADILNISNVDFEWALLRNATPNTAFTWSNATDNVQYSLEAKTFSSLGIRVAGGYMGGKTAPFALGSGDLSWDNQLGETISGTSDTLTLAVRAGSSSKAACGLIKWFEL